MTNATAPERRVTAADIAREVGVSRATVGFVLNSTPGQTISPATQERVLDAARRLGYRPHVAAQTLASGRSHIILLVLPEWPMEYSMRRNIDEASVALDEEGYSLVTMTPHEGGTARPLWETLQPDVVMGMAAFEPATYDAIKATGVPAIVPGEQDDADPSGLPFNMGPRLQVEHLISRGHQRLAYAASADPRLGGLIDSRHALASATLQEHGGEPLERFAVTADNATDLVAQWHHSDVTGIIGYNDDIAALVAGAALRLGLTIPDQIAVVGHDDSPLSSLFVPSLSTIHVDDEGLGRYLAQFALSAARRTKPPAWEGNAEASLVHRESS
ncbi:LacI family DNA-binding transcriptional regulator [Microbacterium sp. P04]|uniref:LacI family DNA-binding transcriptional regulator n=1 Tax=Microbacterium sp. P04 TaxID=3366947 RepID=UPI003745BB0A